MFKSIILAASFATAIAGGAGAFEIESPDISNGGNLKIDQVANVFGCNGGNISPALSWSKQRKPNKRKPLAGTPRR